MYKAVDMTDSNPSINFAEEFSAKIPALTLLTTLGYEFIPPSQCHALKSRVKQSHQSGGVAACYACVFGQANLYI